MKTWLEELRRLNHNLEELVEVLKDLRQVAADVLGYRILEPDRKERK